MPSLQEALGNKLEGYEPVQSGTNPLATSNETDLQPGLSGFSRGPLPILSNGTDNLRTFYLGSRVPQNRIYQLRPLPITGTKA